MRSDSEDGEDYPLEEQDTPPIEIRSISRRSAPLPMLPELEFTNPVEHLNRDWNDAERDAFNALGRDPTGPATVGHVIRLRIAYTEHAKAQDSAIRELYARQRETDDLDDRTKEVERWQKKADKAVGRAEKLFWSALATTLLALGALASAIWSRSAQEAEAKFKLEQVRKDLDDEKSQRAKDADEYRREIDRLRDQMYRRPTSQVTPIRNTGDASATLVMKGPSS